MVAVDESNLVDRGGEAAQDAVDLHLGLVGGEAVQVDVNKGAAHRMLPTVRG